MMLRVVAGAAAAAVLLQGATSDLQLAVLEVDDCGPDGHPEAFGAFVFCYAPGPTLTFYNGTVVPHCTEATPRDDCFVYRVLTPEDRAELEEAQA